MASVHLCVLFGTHVCCLLVMLQSILNGFQHEQPDYWLTFGNPWEIERLIVSYPIKFYGHVSVHQEEGRQVRGAKCGLGWLLGIGRGRLGME
jgi:hypothetical protein